ncbi:putative non-specific serine/threonine protein kinase [Helianthus anomalus]
MLHTAFAWYTYVPQSNDQWSKGNWTRGCVRRSELLCEKNETSLASGKAKPDKFWVLRGIKLPDHYQYFRYMDTDECRKRCLDNCSCKAYANNLYVSKFLSLGRKTKIDNFNSEEELVSRDTLQEDCS